MEGEQDDEKRLGEKKKKKKKKKRKGRQFGEKFQFDTNVISFHALSWRFWLV